MKEKKKLLNDDIRSSRVHLITDDSQNLGEMSLNEAKEKASTQGLDLMQIWERDGSAIVKILDYGKYLYQKSKQERKVKQKSKNPELKTIRITFKISEHDLKVRQKQASKFAENGHPLKISLMLRWRENHYWDLAREKMKSFVSMIEEFYTLDKGIQHSWNNFSAMLKPKK